MGTTSAIVVFVPRLAKRRSLEAPVLCSACAKKSVVERDYSAEPEGTVEGGRQVKQTIR